MARAQYFLHRPPADLQHPRDLVPAHAPAGQLQDRGALILTQHPPLLAWPAESGSPAGSALAPPADWGRPKFSACSGACSPPTLLPFTATSCTIEMARRSFILCRLCESVH